MLAALTAVCLAAALILEAAAQQVILGRWLGLAGLVFLVAAILAPYRPRPPSGRRVLGETPQHPAVRHPVRLRRQQHLEQMGTGLTGAVKRADDSALTGLSKLFGWPVTVWLFFALPLIARFLGARFQSQFFYYSSGWIQLFALPLLTYIGVKLQRSSDAQSEVMHAALTHIATVEDQNKQLLEQNTELTTQIHALVNQPKTGPVKRLATPTERGEGTRP